MLEDSNVLPYKSNSISMWSFYSRHHLCHSRDYQGFDKELFYWPHSSYLRLMSCYVNLQQPNADDLRLTTSSLSDMFSKPIIYYTAWRDNFLKLNTTKCELLISSNAPLSQDLSQIKFPLDSETCRCLGFWWTSNLSPKVYALTTTWPMLEGAFSP